MAHIVLYPHSLLDGSATTIIAFVAFVKRSFFTRVTGMFWCNFGILLMSESSETSVTLFELVISNLCTMSKQFKISFTIVFKFQCVPVECLIRIIYIYIYAFHLELMMSVGSPGD